MIQIVVSIYWFYAAVIGIFINVVLDSYLFVIKRKLYKLEKERLYLDKEYRELQHIPNEGPYDMQHWKICIICGLPGELWKTYEQCRKRKV